MSAREVALWFFLPLSVGGCDPVPFASVELRVRQPENNAARARDPSCHGSEPVCLQLSRSLDGGEAERVWFTNDFRGPTAPLPLGDRAHTLELEVFTGAATEPTLLGRADPVDLPAIDAEGRDLEVVRPVVLAMHGRVEALFESAPGAEADPAVCADEAGNAWFFGASSYMFATDELSPTPITGLSTSPGQSLACAARAEPPEDATSLQDARGPVAGRFYAFIGDCGGSGGGSLIAGDDSPDRTVVVGVGNGCDASVALRDDRLWVVQGGVVTVHTPETLEQLGVGPIFDAGSPPIDVVVLDDGSLLAAEAAGGTRRYQLAAGSGVESAADRDLDVAHFLLIDGVAFALTVDKVKVNLDDASAPSAAVRLPEVTDMLDAAVLRDGALVVLGAEDVAVQDAQAAVAVLSGRNRTALTVTVGGAVLLWGGAGGIDVLVPSAPRVLAAR
ncbi:MAG: hypothetical protein A2138_02600 [Deltaproteobacteria bacterium RBG_16_71_12]|nr:MAG: hypothetical protein A2138_02600 [Deltaproteobacteria bacterium RBG_16_71_12]